MSRAGGATKVMFDCLCRFVKGIFVKPEKATNGMKSEELMKKYSVFYKLYYPDFLLVRLHFRLEQLLLQFVQQSIIRRYVITSLILF